MSRLLIKNEQEHRVVGQQKAADLALYLHLLAREIANELMQRDPDALCENFDRLLDKWSHLQDAGDDAKLAQLTLITELYPRFPDFNPLPLSYPHVLYADEFDTYAYAELWDYYENIRLYSALMHDLDEYWKDHGLMRDLDEYWKDHGASISAKESKALSSYRHAMRNTELLAHLEKAFHSVQYLLMTGVESQWEQKGDWAYETQDYQFMRLHDYDGQRWGVYVKDFDAYGIVSKPPLAGASYWESDETFSRTIALKKLRAHRVGLKVDPKKKKAPLWRA